MATTLQEISRRPTEQSMPHFRHTTEESLLVPLLMPGVVAVHIHVLVQAGGEVVHLRSLDLPACVGDAARKRRLMQAMLAVNARMPLVKLSVLPEDGTSVVSAELWLMDDRLSGKMMACAVRCVADGVVEARKQMLGTLTQGVQSPGPGTAPVAAPPATEVRQVFGRGGSGAPDARCDAVPQVPTRRLAGSMSDQTHPDGCGIGPRPKEAAREGPKALRDRTLARIESELYRHEETMARLEAEAGHERAMVRHQIIRMRMHVRSAALTIRAVRERFLPGGGGRGIEPHPE